MLNFIAAGLASYVTLYLLKSPETQDPETRTIGFNYMIHQFTCFGGAPVSFALPLAILAAFCVWFFLSKTTWGFELRAVGQSESAARAAGISAANARILALSLAGGLAGLVGVAEVLGNAGRFKVGFSPEYGFIGIAVEETKAENLLRNGHRENVEQWRDALGRVQSKLPVQINAQRPTLNFQCRKQRPLLSDR
jgi:simple sugar transport system permease protein